MPPPPEVPQKQKPVLFTVALFLFFFLHRAGAVDHHPDAPSLLLLKSAVDPNDVVLTSWNPLSNPCNDSSPWVGVSCLRNRVSHLVLEDLNFTGDFPISVVSLTQLRVLSLKKNGFSGRIPDLAPISNLKLVFLSHNRFSGDFPSSITSLFKLNRVDLSYNNFSGGIPLSVIGLLHLLTLRLEQNRFTGPISFLRLPNLQDFNVTGNNFTGEIPTSLSAFPASAFSNNPNLCGPPLDTRCLVTSHSSPSNPNGAVASPLVPNTTVASSPTTMSGLIGPPVKPHRSKISSLALLCIIIGDAVVLGAVFLLLYCYFWGKDSTKLFSTANKNNQAEKIMYSSSSPYSYSNPPHPYSAQSVSESRGKIVFLYGERTFELEDLLRASAEMMGRGGFGTTYKAMLDDGTIVAVKRLKDLNGISRREFEQQMQILGRLRHPNLVCLKAYYYAGDEKLLVVDHMPNGSLFWLLHGNRGPGRTPLDWAARFKIAIGAARGLAYIHTSCKSLRLIHGNIRSTNILIDNQGNPKLSDFGLSAFASLKSNGYRAPEAAVDTRKLTAISDVYSFGVLLLELLTGKCPFTVENNGVGTGVGGALDLPKWVQSVVREEWTSEVFDLELLRYRDDEEDMVGLLQIAMACTHSSPDERPKMSHVVKMIQELRSYQDSQSHESAIESVSDSPSLSEDPSRFSH